MGRFAEYFAEVVDPRRRDGDHDLTDLTSCLQAVLCGRSWEGAPEPENPTHGIAKFACTQQKPPSFDHLVGQREQCR